jgi:hypothetical protein
MNWAWNLILAFLYLLGNIHYVAAQDPALSVSVVPAVQQAPSGELGSSPTLSEAAVGIKEKLSRSLDKNRSVTVTLKHGSIYFVPGYSPERKVIVKKNAKIAGKVKQLGEEDFFIDERGFIELKYQLLRVRYEDVEKVHINLVSDKMKSTGEVLFWCVLLLPVGICAP